jgi:hypothetical protein
MSTATPTTDHDEIRRWADETGARPACVKGTGQDGDPGVLRLDFDRQDEGLEPISWETWLDWFDRNHLALLREEDGRFSKLIKREGKAH